jgi:hypothetical protein
LLHLSARFSLRGAELALFDSFSIRLFVVVLFRGSHLHLPHFG